MSLPAAKPSKPIIMLLSLSVFLGIVLLLIFSLSPQQDNTIREVEEYADILMNRELFPQAVDAYREALQRPGLSRVERARLNHIMATIYLDPLKDYANALARYEKVKQLAPKSTLGNDAEKKIIQCLEGLGRPLDAQVEMEESVALKPGESHKGRGPLVAKIGNREITLGEIEDRISQFPPALRNQFSKPEAKLKFLQEYVVTQLLAAAAKRKGYDTDPEVNRAAEETKKGLMVQKLLEDQIASKVAPTEQELRSYYSVHKQRYVVTKDGKTIGTKSFDMAKPEVQQDLLREKDQSQYQQLIQEQLKAQDVKIFSEQVAPASTQ